MKRHPITGAAALAGLWLSAGAASACPWDNETYHAEARSLPCVFEVLVGAYPQHTEEYYEARIYAADQALLFAPYYLEALDMKAVALLKLRRYEEARAVLLARAAADPDGYETHANLGTLYTFTGELDLALEHIDKAMAKEPEAHFGREKYHRMLVVYLKDVAADPEVAKKRDFLGLSLTRAQLTGGSKGEFKKSGLEEDAFDALASMISVYGADEVPDLYLAFGDLLALRGERRLAWTAYQRVVEMKHPRAKEIKKWQRELWTKIRDDYGPGEGMSEGLYRGIDQAYAGERATAKTIRKEYAAWEKERLAAGLAVFRDEGLAEIYKKQAEVRPRCKAPGILRGELAGVEAPR
jgi:tetratricopeptide (TPR) repeat protein